MPGTVSKLTRFPRQRLLEQELLRGRASELDLLLRFGDPTGEAVDGDEPVFYWDLEFGCGLVMALAFHQISQLLTVRLDADDVDHARRHLGIPLRDVQVFAPGGPAPGDEPQPADGRLPSGGRLPSRVAVRAEVWRVDPSGMELLASDLTPRDAACRAAELAARGEDVFDLVW